jgi:hypothetical protein
VRQCTAAEFYASPDRPEHECGKRHFGRRTAWFTGAGSQATLYTRNEDLGRYFPWAELGSNFRIGHKRNTILLHRAPSAGVTLIIFELP